MKGWGTQDDFQAQIEQTVQDRMAIVRAQLLGQGRSNCEDCDNPIPIARRQAYPSCTRCVKCQSVDEGGRTSYFRRN